MGLRVDQGHRPPLCPEVGQAVRRGLFDLIEDNPNRLAEAAGIRSVRVKRIAIGWAEQKIIRGIMILLQSHGLSTARGPRSYKS